MEVVGMTEIPSLDMQNILIQETQNSGDIPISGGTGDPMARKLREKVFLAQVAAVEKLEREKAFRVSEIYLGADILSENDIQMLKQKRSEMSRLRTIQDLNCRRYRQSIEVYPSNHPQIHAGASITTTQQIQAIAARHLSFDPNKSDVWSKRSRTLRRFVGLVSKWIIRNRANKNKQKLVAFLLANNLTSKEAVAKYVEADNMSKSANVSSLEISTDDASSVGTAKSSNSIARRQKTSNGKTTSNVLTDTLLAPKSLSDLLVLSFPKGYPASGRKAKIESASSSSQSQVIQSSATAVADTDSNSLIKRIEDMIRSHMDVVTIKSTKDIALNDFKSDKVNKRKKLGSNSPVKAETNAATKGRRQSVFGMAHDDDTTASSTCPIDFTLPPLDLLLSNSQGEASGSRRCIRRPVDSDISLQDIILVNFNSKASTDEMVSKDLNSQSYPDCSYPIPSWMTAEEDWKYVHGSYHELNYRIPLPEYRAYIPEPLYCEMDDDWILRPKLQDLQYDQVDTLRARWLQSNCFEAANAYVFGGRDPRSDGDICKTLSFSDCCNDSSILSHHYKADNDRHISGLPSFSEDHTRLLFSRDYDIYPNTLTKKRQGLKRKDNYLQSKQDPSDYLTESESDDEELYEALRPSDEAVAKLLERGSENQPVSMTTKANTPKTKK